MACIRESSHLGETEWTWRGPRPIENLDIKNLETSLDHRRPLIALSGRKRLASGSYADGLILWSDRRPIDSPPFLNDASARWEAGRTGSGGALVSAGTSFGAFYRPPANNVGRLLDSQIIPLRLG